MAPVEEEPIIISFEELKERINDVISELWETKDQMELQASNLHPIWKVSLRMTVMYLNMSEAFRGCYDTSSGIKLIKESTNEQLFIEKHQISNKKSKQYRASKLLARTVKLLRILGFQSPLISIGRDSHYRGSSCEETKQLLKEFNESNNTKGPIDDKKIIAKMARLFVIGKYEQFISEKGIPHAEAREIGEFINEIGGLNLMQKVSKEVVALIYEIEDQVVGRELEVCWNGIGDWIA